MLVCSSTGAEDLLVFDPVWNMITLPPCTGRHYRQSLRQHHIIITRGLTSRRPTLLCCVNAVVGVSLYCVTVFSQKLLSSV